MVLMRQFTAYSTFAVIIWLFLAQPQVNGRWRLSPALAAAGGVCVFLVMGILSLPDLVEAGSILFYPLVTIASIMMLGTVSERLGVLDWLATFAERGTNGDTARLYRRIFISAAISSAILNNDTTILILTPLVIALVRRRYPNRPNLTLPFALAVFMAAGVAPLMVSNPINMVVASAAKINFNDYVLIMFPVALGVWIVSFLVLRFIYRRELTLETTSDSISTRSVSMDAGSWQMVILLIAVIASYPLMAYFNGPVWLVALVGAILACLLARRHIATATTTLVRQGVSWETLAFLIGVFLVGAGMRNIGIVEYFAQLYAKTGIVAIGIFSAFGSALMNNHPMAILNFLALGGVDANKFEIMAALIGGDLGPRFLPTGSLAGFMWVGILERVGVHISIGQFFRIGAMVTIPTLLVAIAILNLF